MKHPSSHLIGSMMDKSGLCYQQQGILRWAACWAIAFPSITTILWFLGFVKWTVTFAGLCSSLIIMLIFFLQGKAQGNRWWWLWRGPILSPYESSDPDSARRWIKTNMDPSLYYEIHHLGVKFKYMRHARIFYLHWIA